MVNKVSLLCLLLALHAPLTFADDAALRAAVNDSQRSSDNRARDYYRHPFETLGFFGIEPDMTVVELWPGRGWYSEILAPYLKSRGKLYAAQFNPDSDRDYMRRIRQQYSAWVADNADRFGAVTITSFDPPELSDIAPAGSADAVLTFRNVHNWYMGNGGQDRLISAFQAMHRSLKPGGILGVVDHRLPAGRPLTDQEKSGYMREDYVIEIASKAGFRLDARTDINANPLDTADYPGGVWTLPPSLREGDKEMERYLTIGESDRMTLRFIKR